MPPTESLIDPAARDHVLLDGPDAASYLQSQLSQDMSHLAVGAQCWTFALDPAGKVVCLARLTRSGDQEFDLDTDAGYGEVLAARLARFKIRVQAEISTIPAVRADPSDDHEAERVAAGWPRMGAEIIPGETLAATTGVTPLAVSFTKGCYPGQELVERMESRGAEAPRALRIVEVSDETRPGDALTGADGTEVGTITSVSPRGGVALAIVKRGTDVGRQPAHT
jgi:tRNA-modifying protein YgfZ